MDLLRHSKTHNADNTNWMPLSNGNCLRGQYMARQYVTYAANT
jgi:hypothetical protein